MTATWSWPCAAADAGAAVRLASPGAAEGPLLTEPLLLRQPPGGGPCELTVELPPSSTLQRCRVWASSRTVEAQTQGESSQWEYACSARGQPESSLAPGALVATLVLPGGQAHSRLRLKLLSLATPGCCALWGVVVDVASAVPRVEPSGAAVAALLAAMGRGKPPVQPPPAPPAAGGPTESALAARVAALEAELAALRSDFGARLAALEQTGAP